MPPEPLTRDRVLEATEDVLRRYGPAKATVVDVARALGVSHGSVYRHFRSKAELREAVTQKWLAEAHAALADIAAEDGPAPERLPRWLTELFAAKRRKAGLDPELFATFQMLARDNSGAVSRHVQETIDQLAGIVADGVRRGEFAPCDRAATARAVWDATCRFHDPAHAAEWTLPGVDAEFTAVCELVLRGLRAD
ncbi:TetR family transcriptional regulator [Streptomyces sp. NPDC008139]|uniref:TetR family transcriptional regulator n=1 Tax=Streptomyces sp. NPDC008139 TaxID=3364814 RepID=UPI0036E15B58